LAEEFGGSQGEFTKDVHDVTRHRAVEDRPEGSAKGGDEQRRGEWDEWGVEGESRREVERYGPECSNKATDDMSSAERNKKREGETETEADRQTRVGRRVMSQGAEPRKEGRIKEDR
jgi:hypothetical protein